MSHRDRALSPPEACSALLDRSMNRTCGSVSRLRGRARSTPEPYECDWPNIPPHRATAKIARGSCQGGFTRPIPWGNLLVPRTLVQGSDRLLDLWIADYQELPALHISAAPRPHTSLQDLSDQLVRHRVWFQPPHRPSGSDDLEQVGGVRGCVRRGTVGHVCSPLKDHCAG